MLPHFIFQGSPFAQGLAHGESLKSSIQNNIEVYVDRFTSEAGMKKNELYDNAKTYSAVLNKQNSNYLDGMKGISRGSGINFIEIAMLNLRYELLYNALGKRYMDQTTDGCTAFAIMPEANKTKHVIIGQNWDWIPDIECVLITNINTNGIKNLSFTEAGIFAGKPGMNSKGIGLTVNGMYSNEDDWLRLCKPFHVRCYEILQSSNLNRALNVLKKTKRSCTSNFIIGEANNKAIDIELAPNTHRIIIPKNGIITHANHLQNQTKINVKEPPNPQRYHSEFRQKQMQLLLERGKPLTLADIKLIMQNHKNKPQSLCRHRDLTLPSSQHTITKTAMIMNLDTREMLVTSGNPCTSKFEHFTLD
tara:strand:+ start:1683 stop:2768 length:1086 start_codon:yes stop_codon:yes gene_type:complete